MILKLNPRPLAFSKSRIRIGNMQGSATTIIKESFFPKKVKRTT